MPFRSASNGTDPRPKLSSYLIFRPKLPQRLFTPPGGSSHHRPPTLPPGSVHCSSLSLRKSFSRRRRAPRLNDKISTNARKVYFAQIAITAANFFKHQKLKLRQQGASTLI